MKAAFMCWTIVIPIAVLLIVVGSGATFALSEYINLTDTIAQSEQLSSEERHSEAVKLLQPAQEGWLVQTLGIKDLSVSQKLANLDLRAQHQDVYEQALEKKEAKEWEEVIDLLDSIPEDSFYSNKSQLNIEESKRNILELRLAAEQVAKEGGRYCDRARASENRG